MSLERQTIIHRLGVRLVKQIAMTYSFLFTTKSSLKSHDEENASQLICTVHFSQIFFLTLRELVSTGKTIYMYTDQHTRSLGVFLERFIYKHQQLYTFIICYVQCYTKFHR